MGNYWQEILVPRQVSGRWKNPENIVPNPSRQTNYMFPSLHVLKDIDQLENIVSQPCFRENGIIRNYCIFTEDGQILKHCSVLDLFPEGGQTIGNNSFFTNISQNKQTRKDCFLSIFTEGRQTREQCFLAVFHENGIIMKQLSWPQNVVVSQSSILTWRGGNRWIDWITIYLNRRPCNREPKLFLQSRHSLGAHMRLSEITGTNYRLTISLTDLNTSSAIRQVETAQEMREFLDTLSVDCSVS